MAEVTLRPLVESDIEAHNAGEDAEAVRWLTGEAGTVDSARRHFRQLAANAVAGQGKRGFGVCLDGRLAGYVECNPDITDGTDPGDVNISYATHPWARRKGVATEAVELMCGYIQEHGIGPRAVLRIEPGNAGSLRVAERAGFGFVREFVSVTDTHPDGSPATMRLFRREL
ncbi:GNAT family N-acetyltransferase [Flexivirga oryzae]|uniref:RimJ/RimL family protein N-acetyltransferase n=1 Tax=Flexivirga oryzae TaxID=1794944 RepID=A0A839N9H8_9MICO|nr:GNAT family N-acetyltransferase [Flexivirga oryzae]MBB2894410.1 RimJ/RimL family protein N-acetyltransferase [Flexivirga oryzae]